MITNDYLSRLNDLSIGRGTTFNPAEIYVGLMANTNIVGSATIQDVVATEMTGNGYARQAVTFSADSTYDTGSDNRAETATVNAVFTASGGQIGPFTGVFILMEANAHAPISVPSTDISTSTDAFTYTGHGFSNGDLVVVSEPTFFGLPSPLSAGTKYQIFGATANTFQLSTNGSSAINLTSSGTGDIKVSDATGLLRALDTTQTTAAAASITIADGQSHTLAVTLTAFR